MSKDLATEAHYSADKLSKGVLAGHPEAMLSFIDEVATEKEKLSPKQYKTFIGEVNSSLAKSLPGLSLEGDDSSIQKSSPAGKISTVIQVNSKDHFTLRLNGSEAQESGTIVKNGNVARGLYDDGHGEQKTTNADGTVEKHGWGPKPEQNFYSTYNSSGQLEEIYADGHKVLIPGVVRK